MKRFIIMAGNMYRTNSGWDAYFGTCDTYEQAMDSVPPISDDATYTWWQIIDMTDGKIIRRSYDKP